MPYLLNLCYVCLIVVASPWLIYSAIRKGKYREGWAAKFLGKVPLRSGNQTCVWIHAVSVGEVNQLAGLLRRIKQRWPDCECVISTTTKTGYDLANKKYTDDRIFYCPLDFSWAVKRAMKRVRPDVFVLTELELWPNLIRSAKRHGAKIAVINGRLSDKSFRGYCRGRWLIAPVLRSIDLFAAQNEDYAARFRHLGARDDAVHVTGSLKFDGAQTDRDNPKTIELAKLAGIQADDIVFLAGSTQAPEEQLALETFRRLRKAHSQLKLLLVPRHPERFDEVATMLDRSGEPWQRRSDLDRRPSTKQARVLLVDTVGELSAWWGVAHIAFVGGSMGRRGGQNMIEPAAYGAAVAFGPNTRNFRDVVALMIHGAAAMVVSSGNDLTRFVERCLTDVDFARGLGQRAQKLVLQQLGASDSTFDLLARMLENAGSLGARAA